VQVVFRYFDIKFLHIVPLKQFVLADHDQKSWYPTHIIL